MIYTRSKVEHLLAKIYRKRDPWAHKTQNGVILVIAGSYLFSGSPIFNCMSAYHAGADLVFLVSPRRSADIAASFSPDMITFAREKKFLDSGDVDFILDLAGKCDSVLIGCGLSQNPGTKKIILKLITRLKKPMVIDADAIRAVGRNHSVLEGKDFIITPHAGEFLALTGKRLRPETQHRKKGAVELAGKLSGTILLKGKEDVVADKDNVYVNKTGSGFMTKGGFGDCLAGICAQFLARGLSSFESASAAIYLNGLAGEIAAKYRDEGVLASDMFDSIPKAIMEIKKKN